MLSVFFCSLSLLFGGFLVGLSVMVTCTTTMACFTVSKILADCIVLGSAYQVTFANGISNMIVCQVFFEEQLKKHDGTCALIQANLDAQPKILK